MVNKFELQDIYGINMNQNQIHTTFDAGPQHHHQTVQ